MSHVATLNKGAAAESISVRSRGVRRSRRVVLLAYLLLVLVHRSGDPVSAIEVEFLWVAVWVFEFQNWNHQDEL